MKIGISIGYSAACMELPLDLILRAEELGFESVWTAETYGSDAITPLAFIGARTSRIRLGTCIAQMDARTPANLAMAAQTIDAMCGAGRMMVGLGASGPQIVEGWYGRPWGKPNYRMRDYVAIMKKIWRREGPVTHDGREIALPYTGPGALGIGKPLKSILHGNRDIPVFLGTTSDLNIAMTAEVADGWLAMHFIPGDLTHHRLTLERGFARRTDGMTLERFEILSSVKVTIDADVGAALAKVKPEVALYVGGMGAKDKNFHKDVMVARGYGDVANRIQELYLAGHKDEAAAAVPDEYVDATMLVGPPGRIIERWPAWRDGGLTGLSLRQPTMEVLDLIARHAL